VLLTAKKIDQLERLRDGEGGRGPAGKGFGEFGPVELTEADVFDKDYLTEEEVRVDSP
jgi:hypothetical protein